MCVGALLVSCASTAKSGSANEVASGGAAAGASTATGGAAMPPAGAPGSGGPSAGAGGWSGAGGAYDGRGSTTSSGGADAPSGAPSGGTSLVGNGREAGAPTVHLDQLKQKMDGFGISNTFASEAMTDTDADALFEPTRGLGLSILRIGMSPRSEGSSSSTFEDARKAVARGVKTIMLSIPSAWGACKTNGSENNGGHLLSDDGGGCYQAWSDAIAAFSAKAKQEIGIELYALSLGNEPDFASCEGDPPCTGRFASMLYTADEAIAFLKVLAPKVRAVSPGTKLMPPEPRQWQRLWSNDSAPNGTDPLGGQGYDYGHAFARDAEAWALVELLATHQYDTQRAAPWPSDVPETKPLWMTEMAGAKFFPEEGPSTDIDNGIAVAGWIHDALVNGPASAWLWFWLKAPFFDDNEGLVLKSGADTKRRYTLGNFSRFVRPGYVRVNVSGSAGPDVLLSAFAATDGTVVVVAINEGAAEVTLPVAITGGPVPASFSPWVTSASDNLAPKTSVPVSGERLMATLGPKTVTTFVGK